MAQFSGSTSIADSCAAGDAGGQPSKSAIDDCTMSISTSDARRQGEQLFLANLEVIQSLLTNTARRHRLRPEDAEEFASTVMLRIISDDYAIFSKFRGDSTLRTFLTVVIKHMYLDFRAAQWGKWRPSAKSRRGGDVAVLLERLTMRDGFTFDEACSILEINHQLTIERDTMARLFAGFKKRIRPRRVDATGLANAVVATERTDAALVDDASEALMTRAIETLGEALKGMTDHERLLLKLQFADTISVADIARLLTLDQKPLYRQFDRLFERLRTRLEAAGLVGTEVLAVVDQANDVGTVFDMESRG